MRILNQTLFNSFAILLSSISILVSTQAWAAKHPVCKAIKLVETIEAQPQLKNLEFCVALNADDCIYNPSRLQTVCEINNGRDCRYVKGIGDTICRILDGENCQYVTSYAQGLCVGSKGKDCQYVNSYAQGLCRSFDGDNCQYISNLGQAQCIALKGENCLGITTSSPDMLKWQMKFDEFCNAN